MSFLVVLEESVRVFLVDELVGRGPRLLVMSDEKESVQDTMGIVRTGGCGKWNSQKELSSILDWTVAGWCHIHLVVLVGKNKVPRSQFIQYRIAIDSILYCLDNGGSMECLRLRLKTLINARNMSKWIEVQVLEWAFVKDNQIYWNVDSRDGRGVYVKEILGGAVLGLEADVDDRAVRV
ncbi:hypothetical protein Tco_1041545 [Tanacetum coccineum]|uniref:Uncharacterized protein n=1 Tax=Tanacetum coccineum TaxID=301880 RepID=A0ABQ5GHX1_9ASTR